MRMPEDRICKRMLQMNPRRKRPRRRYRTRGLDQVREDMEKRGQDWMEMQASGAWKAEDFSATVDPKNWK